MSPIIVIDAVAGLEYMFIGHYVHRDISAGNVLLCGEMAKISDLEYAKKFLSEGPKNDPKTVRVECLRFGF